MEALARELLDFNGRATAVEYWRVQIVIAIVAMVLLGPTILLARVIGAWGGLAMLPVIPLVWIGFATVVRRLHDRGKSGWWLVLFWPLPGLVADGVSRLDATLPPLLVISVMLAAVVLVVWGGIEIGFMPGQRGENRFGPDPRQSVRRGVLV